MSSQSIHVSTSVQQERTRQRVQERARLQELARRMNAEAAHARSALLDLHTIRIAERPETLAHLLPSEDELNGRYDTAMRNHKALQAELTSDVREAIRQTCAELAMLKDIGDSTTASRQLLLDLEGTLRGYETLLLTALAGAYL